MSSLTLDWRAIRPLSGGREKGFEELCSQLARHEVPTNARFVRKGTPDAGVECYAILPDGSEWAWQSKYFDTLGDSQWTQLDKSVKAAVEKHPNLVRYFVCIPLDLADGRIYGQKSAQDKWNEHVTKWAGWLQPAGRVAEFVFWGSSEMLERLARNEHVGRRLFWFDKRGFDEAWFTKRLEEAVEAAGPRYTPEVHVELPVALDLDTFGRTPRAFNELKSLAIDVRENLRLAPKVTAAFGPDIEAAAVRMTTAIQSLIDGLQSLEFTPVGSIPSNSLFAPIETTTTAANELISLLSERKQASSNAYTVTPNEEHSSPPSTSQANLDGLLYWAIRTKSELCEFDKIIRHTVQLADSQALLLIGDAGTGKTHLFCDVAKQRIAANLPTILLMGQRFVTSETPWAQIRQQLDLVDLSADEFVGALEAAAQASGHRALIFIDAINEGLGRTIWPSHMAAFFKQLERSPWIGIAMSVRSSYQEQVVPQQVLSKVVTITHGGFDGMEYDATKTFFIHYDLELPSTPLLAPEFSNPLFLKTLCQGLHAAGEKRLPRGFHGITAIFERFLNTINKQLAQHQQLDFDPRDELVRKSLAEIAKVMCSSGKDWLNREDAKEVVNALLPNREFSRSLYRALVVEGLLTENALTPGDDGSNNIVHMAYERFADHLRAKHLLDTHLDPKNPNLAFDITGGLAFVTNPKKHIAPGLLEALWIQVTERCGVELSTLAPEIVEHWHAGEAFRQSLVWRAYDAFSNDTLKTLNLLCRGVHDLHETLNALLTVAFIPSHPLNSKFIDQRLRQDSMAKRDAWWSTYLHNAWVEQGPVYRIVDWASSLEPKTNLEDEVIELAGTVLAWMLTSSNRFLRDRATKALVHLYTGHLKCIGELIERFADVDDIYINERLHAVGYGLAMRSHDPTEVGPLAQLVYELVFASGSPPTHILLRDYARGVIERAIYLDNNIDIDVVKIRPPYSSQWPTIPTEDEIQSLLVDRSKDSHAKNLDWGHYSIERSVLHDDFARYVIGTNSSKGSDWLDLTHDDPQWEYPIHPKILLEELLSDFSHEERAAWDAVEDVDARHDRLIHCWLDELDVEELKLLYEDKERFNELFNNTKPPDFNIIKAAQQQAYAKLKSTLSAEHTKRLSTIERMEDTYTAESEPPRLELALFQRYILKRVFDLGWTTGRFGHFDRFSIGNSGRAASKAERIGKKYQWIAYYEILALASDHFQYRERYGREDGDREYDGPWQLSLRNIDPSCTLRSTPGGTSWLGHSTAWWQPHRFETWAEPGKEQEWLLRNEDLPKVEELLCSTNPDDNVQWLNAQGEFIWRQERPADRNLNKSSYGELRYLCTGYLIRQEDADAFLAWAEGVDFWGRWMPDPPEVYRMFLGEHAWSPASRYFAQPYHGDGGWIQPEQDCPIKIRTAAFNYLRESQGFDCSVDDSYRLSLPVHELLTALNMRWAGRGANFINSTGELAAYDPTAHLPGPDALLLRAELMQELQRNSKLTLCWVIIGEKGIITTDIPSRHHPEIRISGAYILGESGLKGFVKYILDDPNQSPQQPRHISTYRKDSPH